MSDIKIIQVHNLSLDEARQAARKVAAQMELDYEMTTTWEGDLLKFERSGVSGSLALLDKQAQLEIKLGFNFDNSLSNFHFYLETLWKHIDKLE